MAHAPRPSRSFNAPDQVASFFGVWTDMAFDRVEIRETVGAGGNESFGEFYTGTTPIPEPTTVAMLAAGAAGLGLGRRRPSGG